MTTVAKSALTQGRTFSYSVDPDFHEYEIRYPLHSIKKCHYEAKATRRGSYPHVSFSIQAILSLIDTRDGTVFEKEIHLKDEVDVMEKEDDVGDGHLMPGSSIDLDFLALSIIVSSLPLRIVRPNSKLPSGGEGYRVYREEDFVREQNNAGKQSAFDSLKDIDLE